MKSKDYTITVPKDYKKGELIFLDKFSDAIHGESVSRVSSGRHINLDYEKIENSYKKPVRFFVKIKLGQAPYIEAKSGEFKTEVKLDFNIDEALNKPLNFEFIKSSLSKLGDSKFYLENIEADFDSKAFISKKDLNELRRLALNNLYNEISNRYIREYKNIEIGEKEFKRNLEKDTQFIIKTKSLNRSILDVFKNNIIITDEIDSSFEIKNNRIFYSLAPINSTNDLNRDIKYIEKNLDKIKGVAVYNIWEADLIKEKFNLPIIYLAGLNVFNSAICDLVKDDIVTLSTELSIDEIFDIRKNTDKKLALNLLYKDIEMVMKHCPMSITSCDKNCLNCKFSKDLTLKGDMDSYSFYRKGNMTIINRDKPYNNFNFKKELDKIGIDYYIVELDSVDSTYQIKRLIDGEKIEINSIIGKLDKEIM